MTDAGAGRRPGAMLTVALIGGEAAGRQTLKALLGRSVRLAFVCPSGSDGVALAALAQEHGVRIVDPAGIGDGSALDATVEHEVDLLLNVHSLHILGPDLVSAPRIGSFNLHPGPLPAYGGLGAPSWAVFNGEVRYAVTLHWMTADIDAGDVAYEHWFDLGDAATGLTVSVRCAKHGLALVNRLIDQATVDPSSIPRTPQGPGPRRLYRRSEIPFRGIVDWTQPASTLERLLRAASYRPFPSPWGDPEIVVEGLTVGLAAGSIERETPSCVPPPTEPGTVVALEAGGRAVVTGEGLLRIDRLLVDGRPADPAEILVPGRRLVSAHGPPPEADHGRAGASRPT